MHLLLRGALVFFDLLLVQSIGALYTYLRNYLGWKFLLPIALVNLLVTAGLKLAFPAFFGG